MKSFNFILIPNAIRARVYINLFYKVQVLYFSLQVPLPKDNIHLGHVTLVPELDWNSSSGHCVQLEDSIQ